MRTTLDIEDDVLAAAREIAARERRSAGQVVSPLRRQALSTQHHSEAEQGAGRAARTTAGFRAFASRGRAVTNAEIDRLRDTEGL